MQICNVAGFVCQIANIVIILYSLIFYTASTVDVNAAVTHSFWLLANANGLMSTAIGGVVVNHMVCMSGIILDF